MFGPIIASIICVKVFKLDIKWPFLLSELGIVLLGVQIGSTFTKNVVMDIKDNWLFDYCCIYFDIINCNSNGIYF